MKVKHMVRIVILLVSAGLVFGACDLFKPKLSIQERLNSFAIHLTSDRGNIYTDFAIATTGYLAGASGVVFNAFPAGTYTITGVNSSNSSSVTATLNCPTAFAAAGSTPITFSMTTDVAGGYVINSISVLSINF